MTTNLDLDALKTEHEQYDEPPHDYCGSCGRKWPCPTRALIARVEELEAHG
jgi:hypothetical protein